MPWRTRRSPLDAAAASGTGLVTGSPAAARPNGFVTAHPLGEHAEATASS
jgi:hypothetical protein